MKLTFFAEHDDGHLCIKRVKKQADAIWHHFKRQHWPNEFHTPAVRLAAHSKKFQSFKSFNVELPDEQLIVYYDEANNKFRFDTDECLEKGNYKMCFA